MAHYTVYRKEKSQAADRVEALLRAQNVAYSPVLLSSHVFHVDDVQKFLDMLGMWPVALVDSTSEEWIDSHLNEESDDVDVIDFIVSHPEAIKTPLVVKDASDALICDPAEEVFRFFS